MATKIAPPNPPFIEARHYGGSQTPKAIVMHGTVTSDNKGTARNVANWWAGPTSPKSSAHYIRDPRETIQAVPDHRVAYHCGFNTGSIGYELCDEQTGPASRWQDADSRAILQGAAEDVARLCLAYNITPERPSIRALKRKGPHGIYGHNDSRLAFGHTTHTDPRDFPWKKFLGLVRVEIRKLQNQGNPNPTRRETIVANIESKRRQPLLRKLIRQHKPDFVVAPQASRARAWFKTFGSYRSFQYRMKNPEAAGIAILVRKYLKVTEGRPMRMKETWHGPKNKGGRRHQPRVYHPIVAEDPKTGAKDQILGVHFPSGGRGGPNARAWAESWIAVTRWLSNHPKGRVVGDFNETADVLRALLKRHPKLKGDTEVLSRAKVDHEIIRGAEGRAYNIPDAPGTHGWSRFVTWVKGAR